MDRTPRSRSLVPIGLTEGTSLPKAGFHHGLLGVSEESRSQLQSRFTKLAVSYGRLYKTDSREGREDAGEALPDEISTLPAAEVYQNVELLDAVSSDTQENEEDAPAAEQDESQILDIGQTLRLETESALERLLAEIDPDFVRLLDGAKASANSMNPDRVRHVAISLRELFTHVLHALAPTDAVEKWSSDSVHYANGKPTRRARILYVCRSISFGRFSTFLLKDVEVTLAFVDLFQGATHEVSAQVSTEQLIAMIVRMECLLRFLLETAKLAR